MYKLRKNKVARPIAEHIWFRRQRALWEGHGCAPSKLLNLIPLSSNKGLDCWTFEIRIVQRNEAGLIIIDNIQLWAGFRGGGLADVDKVQVWLVKWLRANEESSS